jgi:hypothetical protein
MRQGGRPTLVTNPTHDQDFAQAASAALGDAATPEGLQVALRRDYPAAVVRAREISGEAVVWYVYREGHWVRSPDRT